jgi:hypothetical protein
LQPFILIPFPASDLPEIKITGEIERVEDQLSVRYRVNGDVDSIKLPDITEMPMRKDDLWKMTCFEIFLAPEGQTQYWEFNMSPSGNWNVYRMDAYRQVNMREEVLFTSLPFTFHKAKHELRLDISIDLSCILSAEQKINIGVTAIIQTFDGRESYWALTHPGVQADFHLRDGFTIR